LHSTFIIHVTWRRSLALFLAAGCGALIPFLALSSAAAGKQMVSGGHVPAAVAKLTPVGSLPASQRLNLAIGLPLRNETELDALLWQLYDPASPNYRHYLTPKEFTARFGPTEQDYQALVQFAEARGFKITGKHSNRLLLDVEGAVSDVEKAFNVTMRLYPHPKEKRAFYAPDTEPSVDFSVPILHVSGLDNYAPPHPNVVVQPARVAVNVTPKAGSGPSGTYMGSDFRNAYVPGTSLTGAGQSVGLLQFDGFYQSDITAYESQAGLPNVPITVVPVDGGISTPGGGAVEVSLDIEMLISMAPGVSRIYVYEAPNSSAYWVDLLNRMATDNLAKQISCSWGGGARNASAETVFKQLGAQGQSFFNATGDSDAFTGTIPFPSDSTNITQVGGTTLTTGSGAAYSSETVWNWGGGTGSSGGISTYYRLPIYQVGVSMSSNGGSTTMRNVPDVALTGDNVWVIFGGGSSEAVGGTSCAAPLWAGFTALVNQQAAQSGQGTVGFLNPALYAVGKGANYATCFHDITTGNNFSSSSPSQFSAVAGYDLCTGWGTPNGMNLINALAGPPVFAPLLVSNSFTLTAESCPNGAIDPGETVTVSFGLKNIGTANTTNLVATLLATGGVVSPSGPQAFGVVTTNGVMTRSFNFSASGTCGSTNTAMLQLQDGTANLGTVTFSFLLGNPVIATVFSQNFDGVTAPALPAGWATSASGAESAWVTTTATSDTAPNSVFSPDPASIGVNELDSPAITLPSGQCQLTFRQSYNLESTYDGGVLEIAIAGGAWTDILAAGGSFVSGGYVTTLSTFYSNPLAGRSAWTGNTGGFITTVVNLPSAASGQTIQLRWRCGSDSSVSETGWYIDTVSVTSSTAVCCVNSAPSITTQPASQAAIPGTNVTFQVTASGASPLGYQWRLNGAGLQGAVNSTLTVTNAQAAQAGSYSVLVYNAYGSVISSNAVLTVLDPWITTQPKNLMVTAGAPASFSVTAVGTPPLSYQWLKEGAALSDTANLSGTHSSTLNLAQVQAGDAGSYSVVVSNVNGQVVSSIATLSANFPPVISTQPAGQTALAGSAVSFTAGIVGSSPLSIQWQRFGTNLADGGKLSGSATAALAISNVQAGDMGSYWVVVSNTYGVVTSSSASLKVWPLLGWGRDDYSQADIPAGFSNVTAVAAGLYHGLALRADGTVAAWGAGMVNTGVLPQYGQAIVPGGMGTTLQVAGGYYHSLALESDGTVAAWGAGTSNTGVSPQYGQSMVPTGLNNVVAVAGGAFHSLALRADQTVLAWGAGTTNSGVNPYYGQAIVPADLGNVVAVAAGAFHSVALKADGTVVAWGAGTASTGLGPNLGQALVPAGLSNVVMVAAGAYHSLALKADGTVVAWGSNNYGQTNTPAGLSGVVAIAAGLYNNLALMSDGTMVGWGNNSYAQATPPIGLANVVEIAAGGYQSLALESDGRPALTVQPSSQFAAPGTTVRLLAMTVGSQPLNYQWSLNGSPLAGATQSSYTIASAAPAYSGTYSLLVSNAFGATVSSNATLTVGSPNAIVSLSLAGSQVSVEFLSVAGSNYVLEYKHSLGDATWSPVSAAVPGTGGLMVLQANNAPADSGFYRLQIQ
jgi:alpha-tubulin suppressor-like RCC1 family protein